MDSVNRYTKENPLPFREWSIEHHSPCKPHLLSLTSPIEGKSPAESGLNTRHDCNVEATDADDFTVSAVRFPKRLLEVDKADMRRKLRLFSRYLRCMKLPDTSTTATSVARPIHQELDRLVAEAKLLCHEKLKHSDISPKTHPR